MLQMQQKEKGRSRERPFCFWFGGSSAEFGLLGREQASTFTGLCSGDPVP
jgi:hypothetical protein